MFETDIVLKIKDTDITGEFLGYEAVPIHMTKPLKTASQTFNMQDCTVQASYCVLPGMDPRGTETKDCQDNLFICLSKGFFLAALFDGHGKLGRQVVDAATVALKQQYEADIDLVMVRFTQRSPKEMLKKIVEDCDQHCIERSGVDCSLSGATAVLLLVTPSEVYSASLGDSRGVLACVPGPNDDLKNPQDQLRTPYRRPVVPGRYVVPLALTLDQKPNLEEEMRRIHEAGGLVRRVTDASGHKIGPFRVWKPGTTLPGLAMSRSIGDSLAKSVGVIGTPIVQKFSLDFERDLFAVIASDGVW